jgi:hypothetical protein
MDVPGRHKDIATDNTLSDTGVVEGVVVVAVAADELLLAVRWQGPLRMEEARQARLRPGQRPA